MKQIRLYADEQFPLPVVKILRTLEYDILTVQDAGKAEQKIPVYLLDNLTVKTYPYEVDVPCTS